MYGLNNNANSINQSMIHYDIFINLLQQSLLPSVMSENRLLAELLQKRIAANASSMPSTPNKAFASGHGVELVDIRLLHKLKNGDFIQAVL